MRRTRILVADPLPIFRSGVRSLLERESDLEVLTASDLDGALDTIDRGCPDIALVDLELPPRGGIPAVAALTELCSCHTVVWSFDPDRETVLEAVRAGASGYLEKTISPDGLIRALRGIRRGEAPLSRDLASQMIEALHALERQLKVRERVAVLSERERQVLALVARGARNKQVAAELVISEFTVKRHVQNILHKLGLPSRRAAAAFYSAAFAVTPGNGQAGRVG